MAVMKYNCLKCNGELIFSPKLQKWQCKSCRLTFTEEELTEDETKYKNTEAEEHTELSVYKCDTCGAEIVAPENEIVARCVYCRSTVILKSKLVGKYKPDYIIPFKNTIDTVKPTFKKICNKKLYAPKQFKLIDNYNITGIYVPYWLFDLDYDGSVIFKATRTSSHRSGDFIITTTHIYDVTRQGNATFENIPHDGSFRMDDALMNNLEPYNYKEMVPFKVGFLTGFQAEKYDVKKETGSERANYRAINTIDEKFRSTVKGYSSVTVKENKLTKKERKNSYALLPVWVFSIRYKNKDYEYMMNGQTGKFIGNYPISKLKVTFTCIMIFIVCALVLALVVGL